MRYLGDLETAIWYSLAGLLGITFGIRFALRGYQPNLDYSENEYDVTRLFWIVLILFSVNWFAELSAVQLRLAAYNSAQILHHILVLRYLFLYHCATGASVLHGIPGVCVCSATGTDQQHDKVQGTVLSVHGSYSEPVAAIREGVFRTDQES